MSNFDPTSLTKAKLKDELQRLNIQLPHSKALKQEYIDLYVKHFQSEHDDPHFSSDDDLLVETHTTANSNCEDFVDSEITFNFKKNIKGTNQNSSKKTAVSNTSSHSLSAQKIKDTMAAVEDLTNQELAEELRSLGMFPGPIIASTRRVYEKKLMKLRQTGGGEPLIQKYQSTPYEEVPDDEERSPPPEPREPRLRRRPIRTEPPEEDTSDPSHDLQSPEPQSMGRPQTATRRGSPTKSQKPTEDNQSQQGGGGVSMIVKILALLLVIFFVYLVIVNMDPSSGSNVPKSLPGDEV